MKLISNTIFVVIILIAFLISIPVFNGQTAVKTGQSNSAGFDFGDARFKTLWEYTDKMVSEIAEPGRGYTWGPTSLAIRQENYVEGTGGVRLVQYFDKNRMELSSSGSLVTNGLLVKELVSGLRQDGDKAFTAFSSSDVQVAGDDNSAGKNQVAPVYASFKSMLSTTPGMMAARDMTGKTVNLAINRAGTVTTLASPPEDIILAHYDGVFGHNIARVFWDFQQQTGLVWNGSNYVNGPVYTTDPVSNVFGLALTEPFWVRAVVNGLEQDVLVQLFERRVLTYTPANPDPFKVEMGNVGQHYYRWRYQETTAPQGKTTPVGGGNPASTPTPTNKAAPPNTPVPAKTITPTSKPAPTSTPVPTLKTGNSWWQPTPDKPIHWHWQLSEDFVYPRDVLPNVTVYDIDGELTSADTVAKLHNLSPDVKVICYFDAGVFETYRSDAASFPKSVIGKADEGWDGSYWLDIRQTDILLPIMKNRMQQWCKNKGFDAIEPDETEVWSNDSGFSITRDQNNFYNQKIAEMAHSLGLSVGLKGNTSEAPDLWSYFDWNLNEQCWYFDECDMLKNSFLSHGKAVFNIEYDTNPDCTKANAWHMNSARRDLNLVGPTNSHYSYKPCVPDPVNNW